MNITDNQKIERVTQFFFHVYDSYIVGVLYVSKYNRTSSIYQISKKEIHNYIPKFKRNHCFGMVIFTYFRKIKKLKYFLKKK